MNILVFFQKLLNDELEKMRLSKVMYKEKWTQMVRIIKRNVSDDSDELAELEEDYQRYFFTKFLTFLGVSKGDSENFIDILIQNLH